MDRPIAAHCVCPFFGRTDPVDVPAGALDIPDDSIAAMADTTDEGEQDAEGGGFAWWDEQDE